MILYQVSQAALVGELEGLKLFKGAQAILQGKALILPYKITGVRTPAANIIKQEMLAAGGDCAVPGAAVTCSADRVDIILLGNLKHYNILLYKLSQMPYFGLPQIGIELERVLQLRRPEELGRAALPEEDSEGSLVSSGRRSTLLADGRRLTYPSTQVMGIINVTPDSFYAGSRRDSVETALKQAEQFLQEGAALLDIGGESTRPGSVPVTPREEQNRVVPVLTALKQKFPHSILSVDTYRAETAEAALAAGADIINDISALEADEKMLPLVVRTKAPVILMHMRGTPQTMQLHCDYVNVVQEVAEYLQGRARLLKEQGVAEDKIILDPGFGFAKTLEQNLALVQGLEALTSGSYPVLLAASRKGTIGKVLGNLPAEERLEGTLATTARAVEAGASLVRVHDVKAHVRFIRMLNALRSGRMES